MRTRPCELEAQKAFGTSLEFTLHETRCDANRDLLYEARAPSPDELRSMSLRVPASLTGV